MIVLGVDPGGTTGWAALKADTIVAKGEIDGWDGLLEVIKNQKPNVIVFDEFRLYPWKAKHKSWSSFIEVEVIGVLKFLAKHFGIKAVGQGAQHKKFFNDRRLKQMGLYSSSPHIRDAIRHALYYMEFGRNA